MTTEESKLDFQFRKLLAGCVKEKDWLRDWLTQKMLRCAELEKLLQEATEIRGELAQTDNDLLAEGWHRGMERAVRICRGPIPVHIATPNAAQAKETAAWLADEIERIADTIGEVSEPPAAASSTGSAGEGKAADHA